MKKALIRDKNKEFILKMKVDFIRNVLSPKLYNQIPEIIKKFRIDKINNDKKE